MSHDSQNKNVLLKGNENRMIHGTNSLESTSGILEQKTSKTIFVNIDGFITYMFE
jgi:hypothetical protein